MPIYAYSYIYTFTYIQVGCRAYTHIHTPFMVRGVVVGRDALRLL